eukprot:scaffold13380_cov110-Cylindrotheca_fusiformis.AAC.6
MRLNRRSLGGGGGGQRTGGTTLVVLLVAGLVVIAAAVFILNDGSTAAVVLGSSDSLSASTTSAPNADSSTTTITAINSNPLINNDDFTLAKDESFGFFQDIPEKDWNLLKKRVKNIQPNTCSYCRGGNLANAWFQNHYEPEFACRFEERVGRQGDGGKWICDPHRIQEKTDCLIYSVGSNNDFSFEREVKNVIGSHCEIHTFDPADYSKRANEEGAIYHQWGISNKNGRNGKGQVMKTLHETAKDLGHLGRTVDVFKIDCEGCELDSFETWVDSATVGIQLQQVLVEIHAKGSQNGRMNQNVKQPQTSNFFQGMHKHGYVIFHKEPNIHYWSFGNCVEFAFLKLAPEFFRGMS